MINFSFPGYIQHFDLYMFFLKLAKECPEMIIEGRKLESVYDFPNQLVWAGGRYLPPFTKEEVQYRIDALREYHLHFKHVCTNCLLEEHHFLDSACNHFIKTNETAGDSIIVYNEKLGEYLKEHYPKYEIINSITKGKLTVEQHNAEHAKGNKTVWYYSDNNREDLLSQIKQPTMVELLAAEACVDNCPYRKKHYEIISKIILGINTPEEAFWSCPHQNKLTNFYIGLVSDKPSKLTNEIIDNLYNKYGFNTIKVSGRDEPDFVVLEYLLYYLVKPKYHNVLRIELQWMLMYMRHEPVTSYNLDL